MVSGYIEDFFYSSILERNLELFLFYGDFIFRFLIRRLVVKSFKSFKDKKIKNKGKVLFFRMYVIVRDLRMVSGYFLIYSDFIIF